MPQSLPQWQAILQARHAQQSGADPVAAYQTASGGNAYGAGVPGRIKGVSALQTMQVMQQNRMGSIGPSGAGQPVDPETQRRQTIKADIDRQNAASAYAVRTSGVQPRSVAAAPGQVQAPPVAGIPTAPAQPPTDAERNMAAGLGQNVAFIRSRYPNLGKSVAGTPPVAQVNPAAVPVVGSVAGLVPKRSAPAQPHVYDGGKAVDMKTSKKAGTIVTDPYSPSFEALQSWRTKTKGTLALAN